jgi:hypothetical protein
VTASFSAVIVCPPTGRLGWQLSRAVTTRQGGSDSVLPDQAGRPDPAALVVTQSSGSASALRLPADGPIGDHPVSGGQCRFGLG